MTAMDKVEIEISADTKDMKRNIESGINALNDLAETENKSSKTLDQTAEKAKREALANKLLGESYRYVASELRRLYAERSKASRNGDTEAYARLTEEIKVHRQALRQLNQARQVDRIALSQQAQLAGQVSSSMKNLGTQIANLSTGMKNGNLDVSGMTSSVISFSLALKAGLGPIGWTMLAIEALTAAVNLYTSEQKKATDAVKAHAKAAEETATKAYKVAEERLAKEADARKKATDDAISDIKRRSVAELAELEQQEAARQILRRRSLEELKKDQATAEAQLARIGTNAELAEMRRAHEVRLKEKERENQQEEERYKATRARMEKAAADAVLQERARMLSELEATYSKFVEFEGKNDDAARDFLRLIDNVKADREVTEAKLKETVAAIDQYKAVQENFFERTARDIADSFMSSGLTTQEKTTRESERYRELLAEKNALTAEDTATLQRVKEINARIEEEFAQELALVKDLEEAADLDAAGMLKLYFSIRERLETEKRTLTAAQEEAKAAEAKTETAKLSADAGRAIYESDKRLLQANIELAKHKEEERRIQEALNEEIRNVLDSTKTTGNYTLEDARTRREILNDDADILKRREQELRRMLSNQHLTDTQRKQINAELQNVRNQTRGLAQAQARNAAESRKWLRELEPPKLTASRKSAQHHLDSLAKAYARRAKAAERAASSGNEKAAERLQRQLLHTSKAMGRVSGKADQADRLYAETVDKLKAVNGNNARVAAASAKTATLAENAATQNTPRQIRQGEKATQAAASITRKTQEINTAVSNINTALDGTGQGLSDLSAVISGMAESAMQGFSNISAILQRHSRQLTYLKRAIDAINGIR